MPAVPDKKFQSSARKVLGLPEFDQTQKTKDVIMATFRTENTLGSLISMESGLPDKRIENLDYNPWEKLTDNEKLDESFIKNAMLADSDEELEAVRRQSAKERKDRKIMSEGGAMSFVAGMTVGGIADPINLIPVGGTAYQTYKTGSSILKAGIATGSVAAGSTAAQEAALHATQIERTYGESALNVGASFLLGGVLGVASNKLGNLGVTDETLEQIKDSMNVESKIRDGADSVGAARVMDDVEVKGKFTSKLVKAFGFDPLSRTITSENPVTRKVANLLAENPIQMDGGVRSAVESLVKIHDGKYATAIQQHLDIFADYRKSGVSIKKKDFNELVSREIRNPKPDTPSHIKQAAQAWERELYEPLKKLMIENNLLPDDVDVKTAKNYLNRVWNKQKIAAELPNFIKKTSQWLEDKDAALFAKVEQQKGELATIETSRKILEKTEAKRAAAERRLGRLEAEKKKLQSQKKRIVERAFEKGELFRSELNKLKAERKALDKKLSEAKRGQKGKIKNEIKAKNQAIREARQKQKSREKGLKGERRELGVQESKITKSLNDLERRTSGLKKDIEDFSVRIEKETPIAKSAKFEELKAASQKAEFKMGLDLEKQDYEDIARQISQRIRGTPDGRLPYDWKLGEGSKGFNTAGTKLRGPLKSRTFNIPDELVEEFLENDVEVLGARYLRQTAADIELTKAFDGDLDFNNVEKDILEWWDGRIEAESNPKKRRKLEDLKDRDINDIKSMRDRIRGTYGQIDHNNPWVRAGRVVRDLNYLRFMGGVVASSIPDVARIFMAEGFAKTFKNGLKPLINNLKKFKVASAEAKRYGVGTDALMGGRSEIIADVADYTQGGTAIERLTRGAAEKFGKVNLMDYWTSGVKQLHAVTMQTSIFDDLAKGKIDKRLKRLGISDADAKAMWEQVQKHGKKEDGVWLTGAKNWDSADLEEMWGAALRKESDRVIVVPGQEKPLFMSSELGKTFFQFRSFMFSSTQRMLIAGLQGQDHNYLGGTLMITSLGMMAYAFKQIDAGRELSDDPKAWIAEGIDRSGSLGAVMEINNTLEKISNNNFGLRPMLGASAPASRFASRNKEEALLGPTAGAFLTTVLKVASAGTDDNPWTDADTRALRRLIPYQNLSIIRQGFDKLEETVK